MESEDELICKINRKRKSSELNNKGKRKKVPQDDEQDRLEKLVLGDASFMLRNLGVSHSDSGVEDAYVSDESTKDPAWEDEDDLGIKADDNSSKTDINRKNFVEIFGQPSWVKGNKELSQDHDDDMAVIRTAGGFISKTSYLPEFIINIKRLASLNSETRNEGPIIKCVEFHPKSTVALVAGLSGTASIFQVDGRGNNKLASVQFENFPIRCAHFSSDGNEFIVGSQKHSFFYVYDMMEGTTRKINTHHNTEQTNMKDFHVSPDGRIIAVVGRFGQIHLLSAGTKEWIGNLTQNNNVTSITFSPDGSFLYSYTDTSEVYVWDMQSRSLVTRFIDEGALGGSAMAASEDYLVTGCNSGFVNLYERPDTRLVSAPKPINIFKNLVTRVTSLKFNSAQEILAMASDEKDGQIKMVHIPSMSVFRNFPSFDSNLGRVQTLDFSLSSGYFACGNNKKNAFLYRLQHYDSY